MHCMRRNRKRVYQRHRIVDCPIGGLQKDRRPAAFHAQWAVILRLRPQVFAWSNLELLCPCGGAAEMCMPGAGIRDPVYCRTCGVGYAKSEKALACFVKQVKCLFKVKSVHSVQPERCRTSCALRAGHVREMRFMTLFCVAAQPADQAMRLARRSTTASYAQRGSIVTMNTSAKTAWLVRARTN